MVECIRVVHHEKTSTLTHLLMKYTYVMSAALTTLRNYTTSPPMSKFVFTVPVKWMGMLRVVNASHSAASASSPKL